jgi:hypothetical protein
MLPDGGTLLFSHVINAIGLQGTVACINQVLQGLDVPLDVLQRSGFAVQAMTAACACSDTPSEAKMSCVDEVLLWLWEALYFMAVFVKDAYSIYHHQPGLANSLFNPPLARCPLYLICMDWGTCEKGACI